jgi:hypothetical protein
VSVFRPAARVTSPDGQEWELYAYRIQWRRPARRRDVLRSVAAAVRAARGDDWTIDAIAHVPRKTVYRWTTRTAHKGQVLAQVEGALERGHVPSNLRNATYVGYRRRSAR